jgi:hypothetical protein
VGFWSKNLSNNLADHANAITWGWFHMIYCRRT